MNLNELSINKLIHFFNFNSEKEKIPNIWKNKHIMELDKIIRNLNVKLCGNLICARNIIKIPGWYNCILIPKQKNISVVSRNKKKICEIGFNAGHSLLLMLLQNINADYLIFDINYYKYTDPCFSYLKKSFPKTSLKIIYGNSIDTFSEYILKNPAELKTYDLIHIDGGHSKTCVKSDFKNSVKLLTENGIIIADDTNSPPGNFDIAKYLDKFINKKILKHFNECPIPSSSGLKPHYILTTGINFKNYQSKLLLNSK